MKSIRNWIWLIPLIFVLLLLPLGSPLMASSCDVSYPEWVKNVETEKDLEHEILIPDTGSSSKIDAIENPNFGENDTGPNHPEVTTDTMLQRCNTTFGDTGNPSYRHWVFCRAFRLPSGDTYSNLTELNNDPDSSTPENLVTLNFFHAGNVDDDSEDWLVPFIKRYRKNCMKRPVNVIWMGAFVTKNGDRQFTEGNKWHITSSKWGDNGTPLFDLSAHSSQVYSGHSTASCPFDSATNPDTKGVYVGGTAEQRARRVTSRFGFNASEINGLYVGENSNQQSQCYSGVTSGNPVTASGGGVQFEYNVELDVSDTNPEEPLRPDTIAKKIIPEIAMDYQTDTPPVSSDFSTDGGSVSITTDVDTSCISDTISFYLAQTNKNLSRIDNFSDSRSTSLRKGDFDTSLANVEIETEKPVDTSCLSLTLDLEDLGRTSDFDNFTPMIYNNASKRWQEIKSKGSNLLLSDTPPKIRFRPPHFSSFGIGVSPGGSSGGSSGTSNSSNSCILERFPVDRKTEKFFRQFRDLILHTRFGRVITKSYYRFST